MGSTSTTRRCRRCRNCRTRHGSGASTSPSAYGHPFRPLGFVFHPIGVALDWVIMKPLYMLGGLAPEWFGLNTDDGQSYQAHMPELYISKDAPRYRFE